MSLTEAERAELADNQFAYDGNNAGAEYVRHLPCDTGIYLGEPTVVQKAFDHLPACPNPDGPAHTYRKGAPWPRGTDAQEITKRQWLQRIYDHPGTTEEDFSSAVTLLVDPMIPVSKDSGSRLQAAGFAHQNADGTCMPIDAW